MGYHGRVEGRAVVEHLLHAPPQVLARLAHPSRHVDKRHHVALQARVVAQEVYGVDEHVDALVAELVAPAGRHDEGAVVEVLAGQLVGYQEQLLARRLALAGERRALRHEVVLEPVGQHHVDRLVEQLFALAGGDLAHRGEAVDVFRRLALYGVLALHVELGGHLVAVVSLEIVVEGLVVAGYAAAYARGVGGEDGGYLGHVLMYVEQAEASHPLVAMIHHFLVGRHIIIIEALGDAGGGIREHRRLVVVAVGMEAVHLEVLPQLTVDLVFLIEEWLEVHEDGDGLARHAPATHFHGETFRQGFLTPVGKQLAVFLEIRARLVAPTVWAYENEIVAKLIVQRLGTR